MPASRNSQRGLSLMEVCLIIATVALLAFVLLPRLVHAPVRSKKLGCVNCLKQVGLAHRLFANDHDDKYLFAVPTTEGGTLEFLDSPQVFRHFQALSNELNTPKILVCPQDTKRQRASDFLNAGTSASFNNNRQLSYFVGLDADESKRDRLLSGDRNITGGTLSNGFLRLLKPTTPAGWTRDIHPNAGNIAVADGSVMQTVPASLRQQLRTNKLAVIRLAIP